MAACFVMIGKICKSCCVAKPLSEYYAHNTTKDKLNQKCKACFSNNMKLIICKKYNDDENYRKNFHIKRTKESLKTNRNKYISKYPEKLKASSASQRLIKIGFVKHHWSYNEEHYRDLIYLTRKEHCFIHKHMVYIQSEFMYADNTGLLLDTKEKHTKYLEIILNKSI